MLLVITVIRVISTSGEKKKLCKEREKENERRIDEPRRGERGRKKRTIARYIIRC